MAGTRLIDFCRLCAGTDLTRIVDFGLVPLGNNLLETAAEARAAAQYPLSLNRCGCCGHFQLAHAVAPDLLYATNYTYLSGIGESFVLHLNDYADWVVGTVGLRANSLVVDIGSNDGTALKAFKARGMRVCGVDPASLPAKLANENGVDTICDFFNARTAAELKASRGAPDYVTSHNVLAHVDDLAGTFCAVYDLLKPGGYFGFEVGYFREVLAKNLFDTIYHEHLDYHHAEALARYLTKLGFDIESVSVVSAQGGSIRMLCRKTGKGEMSQQVRSFVEDERKSILHDQAYLSNWSKSIAALMGAFGTKLKEQRAAGRKIVGYGAPTKATLLMKIAGLNEEFSYVAEDNALKAGRYFPITAIPIVPTASLMSDTPDVLVILAWNFADDIVRKLRGKFAKPVEAVVPLPELRTLTI